MMAFKQYFAMIFTLMTEMYLIVFTLWYTPTVNTIRYILAVIF